MTKKLQIVLSWLKTRILRIIEELFPFIYFYCINRSILNRVNDLRSTDIECYSKLQDYKIEERLKDEHDRALAIDDKTSKFTLGLSVSLSIISASASSVVKILPENQFNEIISFLFGVSSLYMLSGGLIALGALKTLPKYGYGTAFEINKCTYVLVSALLSQEKVNMLRHMRNELAFMSLRNGFLIIFVALLLCIVVLFQQIGTSGLDVEMIICDFCLQFA